MRAPYSYMNGLWVLVFREWDKRDGGSSSGNSIIQLMKYKSGFCRNNVLHSVLAGTRNGPPDRGRRRRDCGGEAGGT